MVRTIPKSENTSEHKYNQTKCLSITTRGYSINKTHTKVRFDIRGLEQRSEAKKNTKLVSVGADPGG